MFQEKTLSAADTYLQYDNNGDTKIKALSADENENTFY